MSQIAGRCCAEGAIDEFAADGGIDILVNNAIIPVRLPNPSRVVSLSPLSLLHVLAERR
jgi:hypothetical protein